MKKQTDQWIEEQRKKGYSTNQIRQKMDEAGYPANYPIKLAKKKPKAVMISIMFIFILVIALSFLFFQFYNKPQEYELQITEGTQKSRLDKCSTYLQCDINFLYDIDISGNVTQKEEQEIRSILEDWYSHYLNSDIYLDTFLKDNSPNEVTPLSYDLLVEYGLLNASNAEPWVNLILDSSGDSELSIYLKLTSARVLLSNIFSENPDENKDKLQTMTDSICESYKYKITRGDVCTNYYIMVSKYICQIARSDEESQNIDYFKTIETTDKYDEFCREFI